MFKQFTGNGDWGSKFHTGGNLRKLPHDNSGGSSGTSLPSSEFVSRTNTSSSENESSARSVPVSCITTTSTSSSSSLLSSSPTDKTIQSKKKQRECVD